MPWARRPLVVAILLGVLAVSGCRQASTPVSASGSGAETGQTGGTSTGSGGTATADPNVLSLVPASWAIFNPAPPVYADGGGVAFDFGYDAGAGAAGYLYNTRPPQVLSGSIAVSVTLKTTGAPVFNYRTESFNTCPGTANMRPFFQSHNDWSGEFGRWWADADAWSLAPGSATLVVPLTPDKWSSVYGKRGDLDGATQAAFADALKNVTNLGVTFGGGCFFGHGVFVDRGTGTATLILTSYRVQP